jgi:tyrosyl-tRNA synthetase
MYGKVMSIPDELTAVYYRQVTGLAGEELMDALRGVEAGDDPMGWKARLAGRIVALYHGEEAAVAAKDYFDRVIRRKEVPVEVPEVELVPWGKNLAVSRMLKETGLAPSTAEGRRLIQGGGVQVDEERLTDPLAELPAEAGRVYRFKVGKRRHMLVRIGAEG